MSSLVLSSRGFVVCVYRVFFVLCCVVFFFFQAEDGIRDLVRSRGLGDVYKRQGGVRAMREALEQLGRDPATVQVTSYLRACLLYTSDAADERSSVDLGGRRIIKKKQKEVTDKSRRSSESKENRHGLT